MALQRLTPDALFKPAAYTQVVVASGRRIVFVSGQVSMDAGGRLVAPADVAKLTTYLVGYKPELRSSLAAARATIFGAAEPPASTLVGVQALAEPGYLLEVEAIAVSDNA